MNGALKQAQGTDFLPPFEIGTLENGQGYHMSFLQADNMPEILALQDKVKAELDAAGHASYIVPKSELSFVRKQHLQGRMLGVFSESQLIAQLIVSMPNQADDAGLVGMHVPHANTDMAVIENVLVDSDFRGNKLMEKLVRQGFQVAKSFGRPHIYAEIDTANIRSWKVFLDCGMDITHLGKDPSDGCALYYTYSNVGASLEYMGGAISVCPQTTSFEQQKKLISLGYQAHSWDAVAKQLVFQKTAAKSVQKVTVPTPAVAAQLVKETRCKA